MFVLSELEAPNTKTNSLCVQTHLAIKLFLILIITMQTDRQTHRDSCLYYREEYVQPPPFEALNILC